MRGEERSIREQAKFYFSLGTVVSSVTIPAIVTCVWAVLKKLDSALFSSDFWVLAMCLLASYLTAYLIPEPEGYKDAGKLRLTIPEIIWGFFNSFVLFITVVGANCWLNR